MSLSETDFSIFLTDTSPVPHDVELMISQDDDETDFTVFKAHK